MCWIKIGHLRKMQANISLFRNKGAILILLWVLLMNVCDPSIAQNTKDSSVKLIVNIVSSVIHVILNLLLPLATLYADIKFGGLRFTLGSLVVGFIIVILYSIQNFLSTHTTHVHLNGDTLDILLSILAPFNPVFRKLFTVLMLLYGTDLMVDASSDQFSSFIWWYWCSIYIGHLITVLVSCIAEVMLPNSVVLLGVDISHFICLMLILCLCIIFKRSLQTGIFNRRGNPLRQIKDVLWFAKKHKYPFCRSAFTYWESAKTSRLDLGKKQYGGPFEEEDVESVKCFFRLLPYVFCVSLVYFPFVPLGRFQLPTHNPFKCLIESTYFTEYVIATFVILCNQLVFKQLCSCREISMFSRVGFGLLLIFLSKVSYLITVLYSNFSNDNETCLIDSRKHYNESFNHDFDESTYLMFLPQIVGSIGIAVFIPTSFEFIFAQCPYNMRGLMIGLMFAINDITEIIGWWSVYLFTIAPHSWPSCEVYIYLSHVLVILVCFLVFCFIRKWYTFRLRNNVFFYYSAAEQYYTRLIQAETQTTD